MHHKLNFISILSVLPLGIYLVMASCGSKEVSTPRSDVLEEVKEDPFTATQSSAPNNPSLIQLTELLQSLGYEGLGLQFESKATLDFLIQAFSNPKAKNLNLRLVYTGLMHSYDAKHRSLTVDATKTVNDLVAYIEKNVPQRPAGEQIQPVLPPPVWLTPKPTAVPTPEPAASPLPQAIPMPGTSPAPAPGSSPVPEAPAPVVIPPGIPLPPAEPTPAPQSPEATPVPSPSPAPAIPPQLLETDPGTSL